MTQTAGTPALENLSLTLKPQVTISPLGYRGLEDASSICGYLQMQ